MKARGGRGQGKKDALELAALKE